VYVTPGAPAPAIDWKTQSPAAQAALTELARDQKADKKTARRKGIPAAPALVAAANGTATALTAAYQIAGLPGIGGAAGLALGGTTAAVLKRRATVKKQTANKTAKAGLLAPGGTRSGANSARGGLLSGGGSRGGVGGGAGARSGGTGQRPSSTSWSLGRQNGTGAASGVGANSGRVDGGGKAGRLGRIADRLSGGTGRADRSAERTGAGKAGQLSKEEKAAAALTADRKNSRAAARRRLTATAGRAGKRGATLAAAGTRTAIVKTKPHRARVLAALGRGTRKTAAVGWDGFLSVGAGLWHGIWNWSGKTGWARMRATWARRRAARAERAAAKAASAQPAIDTTEPEIGGTIRRPAGATTFSPSTTTQGATDMSGHHFTAAAVEMARAASAYEPTAMLQVGQDFASLPDALQLVAEAMKITTEKADGPYPLDPQIIELMRGIYQLTQKAAEMAGELAPAFENLHHVDLERHRNPRPGEEMWDIAANVDFH
jgi:hypothetical protein